MKLQNMTVIFIIIMIPIIIVTSYYIGLQIKTITMQKDYTVKLQTAAKDSIQALEINTVEWNSSSSNLADSKRRDVLAAINTFTTSLANSMGIGGAGKERIQTYIPAIAYTMYDGYYIYSASKVDTQVTDENGLTQFDVEGTIKVNGKSYQYILKPYSPYSARYVNGQTDITVNYTLDNYIKVYGTVRTGANNYVTKEGYLVVCDDNAVGINNVSNNSISGIKYRGATITPEYLKEQVYADGEVNEYPYIYDQYDNKQYWDSEYNKGEGNYFTVNANKQKVYLQKAVEEGDPNFSISNTFRKISVPQGSGTDWSVLKIFQILNPDGGYKFYYEDTRGAYVEFIPTESKVGEVIVEKDKDFSAINYCVESYVFTKWVTNNLKDIKVDDLQSPTGGQYNNVDKDAKIFDISASNNPDPENDEAYATSVLAQHKKDVIINTLEKNLAQAQAQAQEMNPNYEYRLPQLTYDEWEQALSNISIIAYMQGMPIGLKYYNNYTIATSTLNKEYVDPDELYFAGTNDQYYHQRNCNQATGSDYVGYRSIDYVAKSYEKDGTTNYYYPHDKSEESSNTDAELECYYCLVNRSTYETVEKSKWTDSYYNTLARERYKQIDEPGTYRPDVSITKTASASTVEYGDDIEYTITIKNNGIVDDTITLLDIWKKNEIQLIGAVSCTKAEITVKTDFNAFDENKIEYKGISAGYGMDTAIEIDAGETITITYNAKILGNLGETIENTAAIYSYTNQDIVLDSATTTTTVQKTIKVAKTEVKQKNVILVVDTSSSMRTYLSKTQGTLFKNKVKSFVEKLNEKNISVSQIRFNLVAHDDRTVDNENFWTIFAGTNYKSALEMANDKIDSNKNNILVFFSDGDPTYPGFGFPGYTYNERGLTILGTDNLAKKTWDGVESVIGTIKGKGVTIYAIGFTNKDADSDEDGNDEKNANFEGLKTVFVTKANDKFINAKNHDELMNAFDTIANTITSELQVPDSYSATSNKIELKEADKIQSIKIEENEYNREEAKEKEIIIEEDGKTYLNLADVSLDKEITITY